MPSIVTLTMNPAVDESTTALRPARPQASMPDPDIRAGRRRDQRRASDPEPGGDALACFPAAGPAGELSSLLDAEGVRHVAMPVNGWTRETSTCWRR